MNKSIIFVTITTLLGSRIKNLISTYIIQPNTIDFRAGPREINPINSVCIPQSLVLGSIALGKILIY